MVAEVSNLIAASTPASPALSPADAMTLLLTAESLLLASLALVVAIGAPGQTRLARLPGGPRVLAFVAVLAMAFAATGAAISWVQLYLGHIPSDAPSRIVSIALIATIVVEPIYALLVSLGLRG